MRIVSWTLAGHGTAHIIGDALRSVMPITDERVIVWTGPPEHAPDPDGERTWEVHNEAAKIDPVHVWHTWPWRDNFGKARNEGLRYAEDDMLADWSCMIDTDERIVCHDAQAFRLWIAAQAPDVAVILAHSEGGTHTRERFFRHPNPGRFVGRTHEAFRMREGGRSVIAPRELIYWKELPKSEEQLRAKSDRDIALLKADLADDPKNAVAWYYLGWTYQNIGMHQEAIDAWHECAKNNVSEEGAMSCFKAGESYLELNKPADAMAVATAGMTRDAGIAELPWLASLAALRMGRWDQALRWAQLAKVHGMGSEAERARVGFRVPRGLGPGPDEVIAFARERMTDR